MNRFNFIKTYSSILIFLTLFQMDANCTNGPGLKMLWGTPVSAALGAALRIAFDRSWRADDLQKVRISDIGLKSEFSKLLIAGRATYPEKQRTLTSIKVYVILYSWAR